MGPFTPVSVDGPFEHQQCEPGRNDREPRTECDSDQETDQYERDPKWRVDLKPLEQRLCCQPLLGGYHRLVSGRGNLDADPVENSRLVGVVLVDDRGEPAVVGDPLFKEMLEHTLATIEFGP